jgi:hypothetical protein
MKSTSCVSRLPDWKSGFSGSPWKEFQGHHLGDTAKIKNHPVFATVGRADLLHSHPEAGNEMNQIAGWDIRLQWQPLGRIPGTSFHFHAGYGRPWFSQISRDSSLNLMSFEPEIAFDT